MCCAFIVFLPASLISYFHIKCMKVASLLKSVVTVSMCGFVLRSDNEKGTC